MLHRAADDARPALRRPVGRPAAAATAVGARPDRPRAVLARAQPRARRAHRAHARRRLPRRRCRAGPTTPPASRSTGARARDHGRRARPAPAPARRDEVLRALTLDARQPDVGHRLRRPRARGRAHGARRHLGRDVGGDQHHQPRARSAADLPARARRPARTRSTPYVKERCALFWGLTSPHDAARRGLAPSWRPAGASSRPTWSCACCASRCRPTSRSRRGAPRDGQALALLQAVGGFQAYRRAVPAPPNAAPGRALPALRAHLPGLGRGLGRRAAQRARPRRRATRATPSRCCACSA